MSTVNCKITTLSDNRRTATHKARALLFPLLSLLSYMSMLVCPPLAHFFFLFFSFCLSVFFLPPVVRALAIMFSLPPGINHHTTTTTRLCTCWRCSLFLFLFLVFFFFCFATPLVHHAKKKRNHTDKTRQNQINQSNTTNTTKTTLGYCAYLRVHSAAIWSCCLRLVL